MKTKQKQTSTTGQLNGNFHSVNQPVQNCVQSNFIAENSAVQNQPTQNCVGQSTSHRKPGDQKPVTWVASPLGYKKYFSFKDCKAWNQYKQTGVTQYIRGEIDPDYTGCAILNIPNDPHPWNTMRSVIDQYYQRERVIAWERYEARKAIKKAQQLEEKNKQLDNARWMLDSCTGELKKELAQAHEKIVELVSNQPTEIPTHFNLLDDLLNLCDAGEWVDNIDSIIDCLISLMCNDKDVIDGSDLYFARRLQQFFMRLDKATGTIADNCSVSPEDFNPTSKNI